MAEPGKEFGPHVNYEPPKDSGAGGEGEQDPRERYWSSGLLEKIISKEQTSKEHLRWRTWNLLEGVLDRQDDWTGRMMKDRLDSRLEELKEITDPTIAEFLGNKVLDAESGNFEYQQEFETMKKEVSAFLKIFIDFGNQYERSAARGEDLSKLAFGNEILQIRPVEVIKQLFDLRGFKEEDGWPSLGEQVDKVFRAYSFLAVQSDLRWADERTWIEESNGFGVLFPEGKEQATKWLRELKLKILPKVEDSLTGLKDKDLEDLTEEELEKLDRQPLYNRFAVHYSEDSIKELEEAVKSLARGENGGGLIDTQSRIAEKIARKLFYYFGLASYYGSMTEFENNDVSQKSKDIFAEGHPWSDGFLDSLASGDKVTYNIKSGYWPGPPVFVERAPDRMFVDFFKYQSIKDAEDLKNKSKLTSVWSEMWQGGKLLREIPWDRMGEFSLKSYWIRYVFLYLEGTGVLPAMMGGGERGWKDNFDALLKTDFWLNVRKSINIVVRDPMITRGDYGGFIEKHKDGIEKRQEEMIAESTKNIEEEKKKARAEGRKPPDKKPLDRGSALEKAVDDELRDVVNTTKREWKKIVYDAALDWWKAKESPYKNKLKDVVERSGYWVS